MIHAYTWALALALVQPAPSPDEADAKTANPVVQPLPKNLPQTPPKIPDADKLDREPEKLLPGPAAQPAPAQPAPAQPAQPAPQPPGQQPPGLQAPPAGPQPGAQPDPTGSIDDALDPDAFDAPEPTVDGPITLVTDISPDPSNIGDLLTLTVTAAYPAGYSVNLPTGLDFGSLHRVGVEEAEPESTGTGFRKQFKITLQYFQVGEGKVPSFPLTYLDDKGEVHTVRVPATTFTVDSLLANENDPQREGEDPPISLEYPNDRLELVIYSALAALLLGFVGMMLWGRWRRRSKPVYIPPPLPAHEVALSALEQLEQRSLVEDGKFQLYYLELTEITKGYIEGRFGIEALDRTTEEIRQELLREAKRIEPLNAKEVIDFLQACDLVKFARFAPPVEEASGALGSVRKMVERSLPQDAPEPDKQHADTRDTEAKTPEAPSVKPDAPEAAKTSQPTAQQQPAKEDSA